MELKNQRVSRLQKQMKFVAQHTGNIRWWYIEGTTEVCIENSFTHLFNILLHTKLCLF